MSDNSIGDDGARALAAALPQVPGLKELDVSNNNIGTDGEDALRAAAAAARAGLELSVV